MTERVILDTGPLVAFFDPGDEAHEWAVDTFRRLRTPLLTNEAVLVEGVYLLRYSQASQDRILEWVTRGTLSLAFDLGTEVALVRRLMRKYRDVPMSLADACLVRMAEMFDGHAVCTLDRDFRVYRKNGEAPVPLIAPEDP